MIIVGLNTFLAAATLFVLNRQTHVMATQAQTAYDEKRIMASQIPIFQAQAAAAANSAEAVKEANNISQIGLLAQIVPIMTIADDGTVSIDFRNTGRTDAYDFEVEKALWLQEPTSGVHDDPFAREAEEKCENHTNGRRVERPNETAWRAFPGDC